MSSVKPSSNYLSVMEAEMVSIISETLDLSHTPFFYFRDKYAFDLLSWVVGDQGMSVGTLKKSTFGFLLQKPCLKKLIAQRSIQTLFREQLLEEWPKDTQAYTLSLGFWGEYGKACGNWYQTSRPGKNLVLQLNFGQEHNHNYYRLIRPRKAHHPFVFYDHPVAKKGHTLAWSRIDVDLNTGEALIEELQNDWLREAKDVWERLKQPSNNAGPPQDIRISQERYRQYIHQVLQPYYKVWDEAVLSASLWFIKQELGISRIYYHTFDSGNIMKQLMYGRPPRSLYTQLPRRFGFQEAEEAPQFLRQDRYLKKTFNKHKNLKWFVLNLFPVRS